MVGLWLPLDEIWGSRQLADAQRDLGVMYYNGHGVAQDYAQALAWFRKAADQGDAGAQHDLGVMYENGQAVTQDYAQAPVWYRKAAEQGDEDAQAALRAMGEEGSSQ